MANGGIIGPTQTVGGPTPATTTKITASGCFTPKAGTALAVLVVAVAVGVIIGVGVGVGVAVVVVALLQ